ncbi:MAG: toprim domain-containing protein [Candidatus Aenigmarchaeota archaeon]|nr:toprim domain-containing protein [Candidatus Aenigmarchaeota archaeon]
MILMFTFHRIEKLVEDLSDFSLIVEGKRDKIALEKIGLTNIFTLSGKAVDKFIETLPTNRKYVILTDFDKEGELLESKIYEIMSKNKFSLNKRLRLSIKNSFGITKIEELRKISKIKEDVYYGKISAINYKIFNRSRFLRRWCSREARRYWSDFWSN